MLKGAEYLTAGNTGVQSVLGHNGPGWRSRQAWAGCVTLEAL